MFGASSELASVMEFGFKYAKFDVSPLQPSGRDHRQHSRCTWLMNGCDKLASLAGYIARWIKRGTKTRLPILLLTALGVEQLR